LPNRLHNLASPLVELKVVARRWGRIIAWLMKYCDSCGCELDETDPFAVCPRCLFGTALDAPGRPRKTGETASSEVLPREGLLARLFKRRTSSRGMRYWSGLGVGGRVTSAGLGPRAAALRGHEAPGGAVSGSEAAVYRFLAEAQIASQLEHPVFCRSLTWSGRRRSALLYDATPAGTTLSEVLRSAEARPEGRPRGHWKW